LKLGDREKELSLLEGDGGSCAVLDELGYGVRGGGHDA
jgi:hypothetical protein